MSEDVIKKTYAIRVQMQALLESIDSLPAPNRDLTNRINNFSAFLTREQTKWTLGAFTAESNQLNEAVEKIIEFSNSFDLTIVNNKN